MSTAPRRLHLFCSYAHEDDELRKKLIEHLSPLQLEGHIELWHDRLIKPGQDWENEIDENLLSADIILLLLSASFTNSGYCAGKEMRIAIERARNGEARLLSILVRDFDWKRLGIAKRQILPEDGKPVTSWENPDEAWKSVALGVGQLVDEILAEPRPEPEPPAVTQAPAHPKPTRWRRRALLALSATTLLVLPLLLLWSQARGYVQEGERWLDVGRPEQAEMAYARALRWNRFSPDARFGLEKARVWQGKGMDRVTFASEVRKLEQLRPNDAHVHLLLGHLAFGQAQDQAVREYQEALSLSPSLAEAAWGLGAVFEETGETEKALEQYQRAKSLSETTPRYVGNVANLLAKLGRNREAIDAYQGIDKHPLAKIELAKLLWVGNQLDAAESALHQAVAWLNDPVVAGQVENRALWSLETVADRNRRLGDTSDGGKDAAAKVCYARLVLWVTAALKKLGTDEGPLRQKLAGVRSDCQPLWNDLVDIGTRDLKRLQATPDASPAVQTPIQPVLNLLASGP